MKPDLRSLIGWCVPDLCLATCTMQQKPGLMKRNLRGITCRHAWWQ